MKEIEPIRFEIKTIENVSKFIESLIDGNNNYSFHVTTDDFQANKPSEERWYIVEVIDKSKLEKIIVFEDSI